MRFDIITLFPQMCSAYLDESIIKRGQKKKLFAIRMHDLRNFGLGPHKKVDDRPYGGGPGMVIRADIVARAIASLKMKRGSSRIKIVLCTANGTQFTQVTAREWAKKYERVVIIAGRYEGVDQRVKKIIKNMTGIPVQELCIGPYVLTGGELPAMVMIDAVIRHIPGVLGKEESLEETRYGIGLAAYTRPEIIMQKGKKYRVPPVLLTGNHQKIEAWRKKHV